jgi:hypothetical protein
MGSGMETNRDKFINSFTDECIFTRAIYVHSKSLFDLSTPEEKEIMWQTANIFFGDLSIVMVEYVILQICKLTDPAKLGKYENITAEFLLGHYDITAEPQMEQMLQDLNKKIKTFASKLSEARNKRIAHSDRTASLDRRPLGGVPDNEWDEFWVNLRDFVGILHEKFVGSPMDILNVGLLSDADSLLKALKQSACFEQLDASKNLARRAGT